MKKIASSVIIMLLCTSMFTILAPQVKAQENVIFQDDFESYAVGTFPSAGGWSIVWNGAGNQYQVVTDSYYASPTKSLQLVAINQWDMVEFAGVKKDFSSSSKIIGFEAQVLATQSSLGYVGFSNMQMGGWGRFYAMIGLGNSSIFACERDNEYAHELQNLSPDTWYKIRVVLDRSARCYNVWINDAIKGQNIQVYYDPWEILSLQLFVAVDRMYFDDVKIFEMAETPSLNGLVGYWKFDEGSGNTATDSSGNNNHGTLNNGPAWVPGKFGKALSFDGVDDFVQIPQSSSLDVTDQITVEAWVYPRAYVGSFGDVSHIVSRCADNGGHIYVLSVHADGKVWFSVNPMSGEKLSVANLTLNTWTHLAMTYDGAYIRLYINGYLDSSYVQSGSIYTTGNWLAIGCKPTGSGGGPGIYAYFNGIIDEVRIYNRALSQQEIQSDIGEISPPTESAFGMYWTSPFYGVTAGDETFFVIHLEYSEGFDGIVTLSAQNLPGGCSAWFDIDTLSPPVSYRTLHVSTSSTLNNGAYVFLVKGESGNIYQMIPVTLKIGTGKITGVVYRDDNGNGVRDSGEPTVSGATLGYYATQNYLNLYGAWATSNSMGEFTLANVPFNVNNEITATATGLTQRCIPINVMNQLETFIDIGIKPPTILCKPVIIDGCKYQLKLLYGADGQVTGGFILNLTSSEQPSYVDPADPANENYAMGITKRVIRAMLVQEIASDLITMVALPYEQIFGQNPALENWLTSASSSSTWYLLMPLTGFSIIPDTQIQWTDRLRSTIFDSIDEHAESLLNLHEWEETPGLDNAVAAKDELLELPGFESPSRNLVFWNSLSEYYTTVRNYYNLLVLKKLPESELSYIDNIILQCDDAGVSSDIKTALSYCRTARSDYVLSLANNIGQYAFTILWDELVNPGDLVNGAIEAGITANLLPIGLMSLSSILLEVKIATIILLSPQETYDNIRDAETGRVVLKDLEKIHNSYLSLISAAIEVSESQTETLAMLIEMEYCVGENLAHLARSALGCSIVGKAMDILDASWRSTMSFFETKEKWAEGYLDFINQRLKDEVNSIASKISVPSDTLSFVLHSPANLCVIDPTGKCIGFDPQTATTINEISTAVYTGPDCDPQVISIASPLEGAYHILLTGTDTGSYTLDIELLSPTQTLIDTCSGFIEPNEIKSHHIFIPESGDTIIVDDTPPTTKLTIGEPKYTDMLNTYVTKDTQFTLKPYDEGSGVFSTAYRIFNETYDTGWIIYVSPFTLSSLSDGAYTITFNSTDNAGNVESTNTIQVTLFSWTYVFTDSYGRGTTLKINTQHKLFQFITPSKDFGVKHDAKMIQLKHTIIICYEDKEMRLIATAVDDKIDFCSAIAYDKQARKTHILIDKPNC